MKYIFLLLLIAYTLCTTKREKPAQVADIYKGIKTKIYKCVANSEKASISLKELATKNLNTEESLPLGFHSIELTEEDRHIIRDCKRDAFIKRVSKGSNQVTPISLDQAVHSKKFVVSETKKSKNIRKLSMLNEIGRLGAFDINGIFPCFENAQPAINVIRDTVNLFRSKDYTGAIINIYDNFSTIAEGLTFCFNSIFPPE